MVLPPRIQQDRVRDPQEPRGLLTACSMQSVSANGRPCTAALWGALRATFVIGPDGVVAHVIPKVTPKTHDDEVLAVLEQLAAA